MAECAGTVLGSVASVIVNVGENQDEGGRLDVLSAAGYQAEHDPDGDTLYCVDTLVHPSAHASSLRQRLSEGRRELCRWLNLRRILAVARAAGYTTRAGHLSPEAYVAQISSGQLEDEALSSELQQGFVVRGVLRDGVYSVPSAELAARVEWQNPDYEPPTITYPTRSRSGIMQRPTASLSTAAR